MYQGYKCSKKLLIKGKLLKFDVFRTQTTEDKRKINNKKGTKTTKKEIIPTKQHHRKQHKDFLRVKEQNDEYEQRPQTDY